MKRKMLAPGHEARDTLPRRFYKNWLSARANDRGGGEEEEKEKKKKSFTGLKWKFDRVPVEILFVYEAFYFERVLLYSFGSKRI